MKRGDGKLHITFNEMGHGDFILISLPNGKMMVIDCGLMRFDGKFWNPPKTDEELRVWFLRVALGDERFLLNNKEIDLLILTHPDRDHCSQLVRLFDTTLDPDTAKIGPATKVKQVFYGNVFGEYGKQKVPSLLWDNKIADQIFSVTLRTGKSSYAQVKQHDRDGTIFQNATDITASTDGKAEILKKSRVAQTKDFVLVLDGTAAAKNSVHCGVYLLAANVEANDLDDAASDVNRSSIVTAVVYGEKKFLFMGDATFNTENFLISTYGNLIKNVELVHVPHHASHATSSSFPGHPPMPPNPALDFVGHTNPQFAVVTAAYDTGPSMGLPRREIIERYHGGTRMLTKPNGLDADMYKIYCYKSAVISTTVKGGKKQKREVNVLDEFSAPKHIWCTGSHGPIDFDYEQKVDDTVDRV